MLVVLRNIIISEAFIAANTIVEVLNCMFETPYHLWPHVIATCPKDSQDLTWSDILEKVPLQLHSSPCN